MLDTITLRDEQVDRMRYKAYITGTMTVIKTLHEAGILDENQVMQYAEKAEADWNVWRLEG